MPRRRLLLLAAAACLLAAPFVVRWAVTPKPGVTLENFTRLHAGMELAQIVAIMGRDADHISGSRSWWWNRESGVVCIVLVGGKASDGIFGLDADRIQETGIADLAQEPEPLLAKIRRWLGL